MSGFKTAKAVLGRRVLATTAAFALATAGILVGTTSADAATPKTGGTLYYITHADQFDHVDPTRVYTGQHIAFFNTYIFRNLTSYKPVAGNAGYSLVGDLATNTGVPSNKAKDWKFTLRSGVKWEDGTPVTCEDVKYGISRAFATDVITDGPTYAIESLDIPKNADGSSKYAGPYKKTGQALFDKAVNCNGNTITFHLNRSFADWNFFMSYPAGGPVKKSKDTGDKYDLRPMSTGPYKIASYKIGDEMHLVRNSKWSKATDPIRTPYPDDVVVRFGLDEDVRDQIMLQDQIPNTVNLDSLKAANVVTYFEDPSKAKQRMNIYDPYVRYWAMNVSAGHMDCPAIRKAVFFAINTQSIIDLYGGTVYYGVPGDNPVKPNLGPDYVKTTGNIHDPNWKITGNPTYAKSLLDSAQATCPALYKRATTDGLVLDISNSATNQKVFTLLKSAFDAAGIVVKANFIPPGTYYSTVQDETKQNDFSAVGWGADWANASTVIPPLFIKGSSFNLTQNYKDAAYPAFKALVDQALSETNRTKQIALWHKASQYVMDQYWIVRPIFGKTQLQWGSKVGGVQFWGPQGTFLFPAMYVKG